MVSGLGDPQNDTDATNKRYIDTEIANLHVDASPLLPRDGSRKMTGDLNMDDNHILFVDNLTDYKEDDPLPVRVKDLKSVVNKEYLNTKFLKKDKNDNDFDLKQNIITNCEPYYDGMFDDNSLVSKAFVDAEINKLPKPATDVLKLDGSKAMTGDLDMNNNSIINMKDPTAQSHGANKKYVDEMITNSEEAAIQAVIQENVFDRVMNEDLFGVVRGIKFISVINYNLLHQINQKTYLFQIYYDTNKSYYDARLLIDLTYLSNGNYTMVFEMKFVTHIDQNEITVNAVSSTLNQVETKTRVINFDYGYYSRSIINFQKNAKGGVISHLDIDLHLYLKKSVSPTPNSTPINVIVYGVRGSKSDVPIQIWDRVYHVDNKKVHFEADIDMANHKIMNLKDPTAEDHGANKKYVDEMITNSEKRVKEVIDQENVFKRVMDNDEFKEDDDDIHKIGAKNKDFHMINKKTYEFKIDYDSAIGYYSTRLSIDLIYIDAGSYTMVFEMYVDNGLTVDEIEGSSGTLSGVTTKSNIDGTKTRSIINFSYNGLASGFNDLDIDIKLKSKTDPQTTIYVVVYGVKGNFDDVSVDLWDRLYYYNNESINYEVPIDMKGKKITGVGNGTSNSDTVNYQQLIDYINTINNYYFYSSYMEHSEENELTFPKISHHPYPAIQYSKILKISLNGYYQIIYTDAYKRKCKFIIYDMVRKKNLFFQNFNDVTQWTPFIVSAVIKIDINPNHSEAFLKMNINDPQKLLNPILDGRHNSTFFIKYLGP